MHFFFWWICRSYFWLILEIFGEKLTKKTIFPNRLRVLQKHKRDQIRSLGHDFVKKIDVKSIINRQLIMLIIRNCSWSLRSYQFSIPTKWSKTSKKRTGRRLIGMAPESSKILLMIEKYASFACLLSNKARKTTFDSLTGSWLFSFLTYFLTCNKDMQ